MSFLIILTGIIVLLLLIIHLEVNAFLALIVVAIGVGIGMGMPFTEVMGSVKDGVGGTLGYLALVLGFGAMLGGLLSNSGAAKQIADYLINSFGEHRTQWAMVLTGFIIGIPLFYSVAFVMMIPLIFSVVNSTKLPLLYVAVPMIAALSVTHGFLPPHPAPTAISVIYEADITLTFLYGFIIAIPTIIIAGPFFAKTLKGIKASIPEKLLKTENVVPERLPSMGISMLTALMPVILMGMSAIAKLTLVETSILYQALTFIGEPVIALLLSLLIGMYTLGIGVGLSMKKVSTILADSAKGIAMIMLIIGAGGAFKQVLIDSGISDEIVAALQTTDFSPLFLAWLIAAALRITLGSATVAALTAAGIASPLIANSTVSPELLVLATGAGSLTFSQVNDTGFWLFKEYFNLSIWDTFRSWTMMETIVSIIGLIGCLALSYVV